MFITYLYNLFKGVDFNQWDVNDYAEIYDEDPRGIYPKVLGCFLQQAFSKYGCIPVDTWVQSFFEEVLQAAARDGQQRKQLLHTERLAQMVLNEANGRGYMRIVDSNQIR